MADATLIRHESPLPLQHTTLMGDAARRLAGVTELAVEVAILLQHGVAVSQTGEQLRNLHTRSREFVEIGKKK